MRRICEDRRIWRTLASVAACLAGACSPQWFVADADREVNALLAEYEHRVIDEWADGIVRPATLPPEPAETETHRETRVVPEPAEPPILVDLATALETAFASSRDFQDARESLYLTGLGYTLTRHNFGPVLNSTVSYLWSDAEDAEGGDSLDADFGVGMPIPTGADVRLDSSVSGTRGDDPGLLRFDEDTFYDALVRVQISQPLLRGGGRLVRYESLTQGERNLVYAVRDFELFREDFAILIANAYFDLVSQKQQLVIVEQDYEAAVFDSERAKALQEL
ncbi:MAG: TolC family protein, partial [Phycisphaerales bacterium]|nr:TolC family protein [Phycisphaerales bacterium]